jgi:hypothetical protein
MLLPSNTSFLGMLGDAKCVTVVDSRNEFITLRQVAPDCPSCTTSHFQLMSLQLM